MLFRRSKTGSFRFDRSLTAIVGKPEIGNCIVPWHPDDYVGGRSNRNMTKAVEKESAADSSVKTQTGNQQ